MKLFDRGIKEKIRCDKLVLDLDKNAVNYPRTHGETLRGKIKLISRVFLSKISVSKFMVDQKLLNFVSFYRIFYHFVFHLCRLWKK